MNLVLIRPSYQKIFLKEGNVIRMGIAPIRKERVVDKIDGVEVNIISLNKLKINKKASGRYKDLGDYENLPCTAN